MTFKERKTIEAFLDGVEANTFIPAKREAMPVKGWEMRKCFDYLRGLLDKPSITKLKA